MKANAVETEVGKMSISRVAVLKMVAISIVSVILGAGKLFGAISPFSVAFTAALPKKYLITGTIGALVGAIIFTPSHYKLYYIVATIVIFAVRLMIARLVTGRAKPVFLGIVTLIIMSVLATLFTLFSALVSANILMLVIEAVLASCFTYFYAIATNSVLYKKASVPFSSIELSSLAILFIPIVTSLAEISLFRVNLGVVFGVVAIYVAIAKMGIVGASIGAIIVSIALNIYSLSMLPFSGMLIITAFFAGVFAPAKKLAVMSVFVGVSTFALFLLGAPLTLAFRVIEILFATGIFVVIPSKWLNSEISKAEIDESISPIKSTVYSRLQFVSGTMKDLRSDLADVSKRFNEIDANNITSVYDAAASRICKGCTMQLKCWDDNSNETIRAFYPLNTVLRQYRKIEKIQMPSYFQDNCCKLSQLTNEINNCFYAYTIKEDTKRHVTESRGIVIDHFNSIADMLVEVGEELSEISSYDMPVAKAAASAISKLYFPPTHVTATSDKYNRLSIEIYMDMPVHIKKQELFEAVSNATNLALEYPSISVVDNITRIAFYEKAKFSVDFAAEQKCCSSEEICGDCYEHFVDGKGYAYSILSDGMGSGKRAAIDSVMACSILKKLISAGFSMNSSLKLLNSSLLVKSEDESLATLDVSKIDLYTGDAEIYKAGAASSFICKNSGCTRIDTTSLPIGIIREVELQKTTIKLLAKDVLVMVSDGMLSDGDEWIRSELISSAHLPAKEIARKLLFMAQKQLENVKEDDQTVIVLKLLTA